MPFISILTVNYNTCVLLEQCLKSIFDARGDFAIEVFIADNNSTDGSPEMVKTKFPEVYLVNYSENMGYSRAINPLLPLARGKYHLLIHPDVEFMPNTLKEFVQFFETHPQAGIVGGNLYYPDGTPNPCETLFPSFKNDLLWFAVRFFRRLPGGSRMAGNFNPMEWSHKSTSEVNWVWNACMMVRKEVFEGIGHFDEDFFVWYADWDLCKRAADAGWSVYYLKRAMAIHHERHSFDKEDIAKDEIRYKVDGWYSMTQQIKDRHVFLKKHTTPASILGMKMIHVMENLLRLWLILANLLSKKAISNEAAFQIRTCLRTIQAILKV